MAKGISLHIGLNYIDPTSYGDDGHLLGCENDARDCLSIAKSKGFKTTKLLNEEATSDAIFQFIQQTAETLSSGDIFFISYSGHGSQVPDMGDNESGEEDGKDETWCLYDRMVIDDELKSAWSHFKSGVRILILSDSCHSGTVDKEGEDQRQENIPTPRRLPIKALEHTLKNNKKFYKNLRYRSLNENIVASVVLLAGCQDDEESLDIGSNGAFTATLKRVWDNGSFGGNYEQLLEQIKNSLGSTVETANFAYDNSQHPNLSLSGNTEASFSKQKPFSI